MILGVTRNKRAQAEAALGKGNRKKALKLLEKVLESEPGDLRVRRDIAELYKTDGNTEAAIRHYEALAGGHAAAGLMLRAIAACKQILELDPEHHRTQEVLASLYAKKRKGREQTTLPPTMSAALLSGVPTEAVDDDDVIDADDVDASDAIELDAVIEEGDVLEATTVETEVEASAKPPPELDLEAFDSEDAFVELTDEDLRLPTLPSAEVEEVDPDDIDISVEEGPVEALEKRGSPAGREVTGAASAGPAEPAPLTEEIELDAGDFIVVDEEGVIVDDQEGTADVDISKLPESPLFSQLGMHAFEDLVTKLDVVRANKGTAVIRQGDVDDSFFIIVSGRVRIEREAVPVDAPEGSAPVLQRLGRLGEGAFFGEIAILAQNPRSASVVVEEDAELFEVKRAMLDELIERHPSVQKVLMKFCRRRLLENLVVSSPIFRGLDREQQQKIIKAFRPMEADTGEVVIRQGESSKALFVVLSGAVEVAIEASAIHGSDEDPHAVTQLVEGDVFGEMGLFFDQPASATVTAKKPTQLLRLSGRTFTRFCADHPEVKDRLEDISRTRAAENRRIRTGLAVRRRAAL